MAKKNKKVKKKKQKKKNGKSQLFLIVGLLMAILFLPSTLLLCVGLLPTPAAALMDRSKGKSKVLTVGAMNLAGCMPFLLKLWMGEHSFSNAVDIISDPTSIIVMYSAAGVGYLISWAMGGLVSGALYQKGRNRQDYIKKRQADLIERWGSTVTGQIALDEEGFALNPEDVKSTQE